MRPRYNTIIVACAAVAVLSAMTVGSGLMTWNYISSTIFPGNRVDFSRDIRPIFNQNCVACHGGVRQRNDVSFIYRDEALGVGKSGHRTIVPGSPNASE